MKDIRAATRAGVAISGLLCALIGSVAWAQSPSEQPLIAIVQPAFDSTQEGATVTVRVHFGPEAVTGTFRAQIISRTCSLRAARAPALDSATCRRCCRPRTCFPAPTS